MTAFGEPSGPGLVDAARAPLPRRQPAGLESAVQEVRRSAMRVMIARVETSGDETRVLARPEGATRALDAAWDGPTPAVGESRDVELDIEGGDWGEAVGPRASMEGDDVLDGQLEMAYPDEGLAVVRIFGGLVQVEVEGLRELSPGVEIGVRARGLRLSDTGI